MLIPVAALVLFLPFPYFCSLSFSYFQPYHRLCPRFSCIASVSVPLFLLLPHLYFPVRFHTLIHIRLLFLFLFLFLFLLPGFFRFLSLKKSLINFPLANDR